MIIRKLRNRAGATLVEVMVALIITGLLATASFQFYSDMNGRTLTQQDLSDLQHICRVTVYELKKSIRMAGYKIGSHDPYAIDGDTLTVYRQGSQPVDTIRYYLVEASVVTDPDAETQPHQLFQLMKQVNSDYAVPMSDQISALNFQVIDTANIQISVSAESTRRDHEYQLNDGYKTYSLTERVRIRNID